MWVYQEMQLPLEEGSASAESKPVLVDESTLPVSRKDESPDAEARPLLTESEKMLSPPKAAEHRLPVEKDCILLAAAYLLGAFLAGVAAALCSADENEVLQYYLNCWQRLFTITGAADVVRLFRTELLTMSGALVTLLLLGLSALGPLPILFFMLIYGTGSGIFTAQLLPGLDAVVFLRMFLLSGLPTALAASILCVFGVSAMKMSSRLSACALGRSEQISDLRELLVRFGCTLLLLLPLCGIAVCLLYIAQ